MSIQSGQIKEKYTIVAPEYSDACIPGALLSVDVNIDEKVKWVWTHLQNGQSAVTGYQIIKKEVS